MISVMLADDQTLVRAGFRSILEGEDDLEVVAEAADGQQAVEQARVHVPDVVLMDIRMPRLDGIAATAEIAKDPALTTVRVIILTTYDVDDHIYSALRAGASGFLVKDTEPVELIHAVRVVARGDGLLSPSVTRRLISDLAGRAPAPLPPTGLDSLTDREHEVLMLVAQGLSNVEIAQRLMMSPATAKTHVSRVLAKLCVRDRAQMVVLAYEAGLVRPGWL
jgi:DNA-binding NarL/FixJ family response regulator